MPPATGWQLPLDVARRRLEECRAILGRELAHLAEHQPTVLGDQRGIRDGRLAQDVFVSR